MWLSWAEKKEKDKGQKGSIVPWEEEVEMEKKEEDTASEREPFPPLPPRGPHGRVAAGQHAER